METWLETHTGYLTDEEFCNNETCIVYPVNCISCVPYGMAKDISVKYKHASAYGERRPLYNLKRCVPHDRPIPGSIHVSNRRAENLPCIIAAAVQYGIGAPVENNEIAKSHIEKSKDRDMLTGLKEDTTQNRLIYFKKAIEAITRFIKSSPEIARVVLPVGIGRTCVQRDEVWEETYLPIIEDLYENLKHYDVNVILVRNDQSSKEKKNVPGNSTMRSCPPRRREKCI